MKIAVIGGGINGVMAAWALAEAGFRVSLFERGELMAETSAASSKMLHGGIRYLEQRQFSLVREALTERAWWLENAPHLARKIPILIPVHRGAPRGRWLIGAGVALYDFLARGSGFPKSAWHNAAAVQERLPHLKAEGLVGAWEYWDGLMDDRALGLWAADQARAAGVVMRTHANVGRMAASGDVLINGNSESFDCVINAGGPWAGALLEASHIESDHKLDLVRGSHLVINRRVACGCVLQDAGSRRVVFVLPQGECALLGTTEVLQANPSPTTPSDEEIRYLIDVYNRAFNEPLMKHDIVQSFAGVRPVVRAGGDFSSASRESVIEVRGRVVSIFGGKWTTSRALGERVLQAVREVFRG